jgi:hypothetical protein
MIAYGGLLSASWSPNVSDVTDDHPLAEACTAIEISS